MFQQCGWSHLVKSFRGPSKIASTVKDLPHPASALLCHLRKTGASARFSTKPWGPERIHQAIQRGCHQSALGHSEFLFNEMADMIEKGQWLVLPAKLATTLPNLRISPIGIVPQHERRPRTIVDYTYSGVNQDTVPLCFPEAMQFGRALDRILRKVAEADPRHGPVHLSKTDITDGFYNVRVNLDDIPTLGVVIPKSPGGDSLIAFPLALPMGWVNSPCIFSGLSETNADLTNMQKYIPSDLHNHNSMEDHAASTDSYERTPPYNAPLYRRSPIRHTDIYVDDFIQLMQGSRQKLRRYRRRLFNIIHKVFAPLTKSEGDPQGDANSQNTANSQNDPISLKKLLKGDAAWSTIKTILGWVLNTVAGTIHLPERRQNRLHEILASISPDQRRISLKKWHKILGELRSMELALPGLRGMFSTMQEAFRHQTAARISLGKPQHDFLEDIRHLAQELKSRPTHVQEVVPSFPSILGASDAAKPGMGGIAFSPEASPIMWRAQFPQDIRDAVVSDDNPRGTITNSDLELAGTIAHHDVIAQHLPVQHRTLGTATDNTPALAWQRKGSATTLGPAAYLLRCQALHQRHYRYQKTLGHIPGTLNKMADDTSRRWDLTDDELTNYFNATYPQTQPWKLLPLRPVMLSALTSSLRKMRPAPASFLPLQCAETKVGPSGQPTVNNSKWIPPYARWPTPSKSSWSTPTGSEQANAAAVASPSKLAQWIPNFAMWARRSPFWGPRTLV